MCVWGGVGDKTSAPLFLKMSVKKHKRGDIREDGKMFWRYRKDKKGLDFLLIEEWLTPEKYEKYYAKQNDWAEKNQERFFKLKLNWRIKNRDRILKNQSIYRSNLENKKRMQQYHSEYMQNPKNKKRKKEYCSIWYRKNRERILKRQAEYYQNEEIKQRRNEYLKSLHLTNPQAALARRIRKRIRCALRSVNACKSGKTVELIGCSFKFLKQHIESQFKKGMAWDKPNSFHIDHIRPLSSFDLNDPEQQKIACHWTNLQPLSPIENLKKGAKIYPHILNV
jgi:hypothetical protein